MREPIVFFGNERIATGVETNNPALRMLVSEGYDIKFIVVNQSDKSHGRQKRELEIESIARENDIEVHVPTSDDELVEKIKSSGAKTAVLIAYGKIIKQEVIDAFENGIINIHPSLLPELRGPTPLETYMLSGESETGVSLMQLAKGMDNGPIFAQEKLKFNTAISKQELADKLLGKGVDMLKATLPGIVSGQLEAKLQHGEATFSKQITKQDGDLNFIKGTAMELERQVRAFYGWPGSFTELNGKRIVVNEARALSLRGAPGEPFVYEKQLAFYCKEGALLIEKLKPEGKKEMASRDYLLGHPLN